ncbi:RagB/SusD family nutrient uptake outer membrane protein [uncultured Bacteroides sp.]|uniref:RagB/SusD family nutrient uptake outer membrane protein n=1 Tax=uncultured Bacteroides sp. TaxID=162156 RepID=UPI002675F7BF|nr:RagB/SusD family nutrient uptake outer membrane protein [uncultured Bacteroides sp.]
MRVRYIIISMFVSCLFVGCTDILDKRDLMSLTDEDVWNTEVYATDYLNQLYRENLPRWNPNIAGYSDEADDSQNATLYGQLTTQSVNVWPYDKIRNINILLKKMDNSTLDIDIKEKLKAQAAMLRAWKYFQMVRLYGGIPLILEPQSLDDDIYVKRNKTSECIAQIVKDLDYAYEILPWHWEGDDEGRFTKAAALALKGRILLYYASPQFNPDNNQARWETAYIANKKALDELIANGYGLYDSYENLWFDEMNKEVVMVSRYYSTGEGIGLGNPWNAYSRPVDEAQNYTGANHPTWEMVQSYPMSTGESIDESDDYDSVLFWKNRDPRFKQTVAYNGCIWELSGKTGRRQWTYEGAQGNFTTETGFYCRKAVDTSYSPVMSQFSSTDWIEIRFAEVMLNYAECAAEIGKSDESYSMLKHIRKRAGIKAGADGMYGLKQQLAKRELVDAVMLERKIELAYEGKRYWDLRRRRLFAKELNGKVRHGMRPHFAEGMDVDKLKQIQDSADFENNYSLYFKDVLYNTDKKYTINFKDNYYFFAIPNEHLETNSLLEQTVGWNNGTFNPLD